MLGESRAARSRSGEALGLESVTKVYGGGTNPVTALNQVTLSLSAGTFTSVTGPSGSGKTTLLQCAAGLDQPSQGQVFVGGEALPSGGEAEVTRFRRDRIGFVFQRYNLIPYLTVLQNVLLPLRLAGRRVEEKECADVVARLGLTELVSRRPPELSGGQQQRVAIARALVTRPAVLFADEPTGALDATSGREVLGLLREAVEESGQTVVLVTHDPLAASYAGTVVFLADGSIVDQLANPTADRVASRMTQLDRTAARRAEAGL